MKSVSVIVAVAAAMALAAVGVARGTYAAGGSDSSCYALMADAFASGAMQPTSALEPKVPWPDAPKTFAPGGFVPSQSNGAASAPVCAPGFSLILAPFLQLGGQPAMFAVTPIAGALLVWFAFLAARALGGPFAGAIAAVLVATSPIVLFQVVQPMNDIVTSMLWLGMFYMFIAGRWSAAGAYCGLGLLVRPNLLPLAMVAGLYALAVDRKRALAFVLPAVPFITIMLFLNHELYGSAWRTGYGHVENLFDYGHVAINAPRYMGWLIETQTAAVVVAAFAAPAFVERGWRPVTFLAIGMIAATVAIYLAYTPFDDWSYLRFLLPAIALLLVLTGVAIEVGLRRRGGQRVAHVLAAAAVALLAIHGVSVARNRLAFQMRALEQRYRSAGMAARDELPAGAAILTTWDSGAIRFHARKEAIVWDALDPAWLDRAVAWLSENGHPPFILVESWEEPRFRARFGGDSPLGNLDWPAKYEVDRVVRIYDPADRARYLRGETVITEYLWPLRGVR